MSQEIRPIKDFENYGVSESGQVFNLKTGRELTSYDKGNGYLYVKLYKDGQGYNKRVHRLVAEAFIPNPRAVKEVDHIDGNRRNNSVSNLQWCNRTENLLKAGLQTPVMNITTGVVYDSIAAAAQSVGYSVGSFYNGFAANDVYTNKAGTWVRLTADEFLKKVEFLKQTNNKATYI